MRTSHTKVSFADLQQWPDTGRHERYELYDGEVIVSPTPRPRHQRVAMHIGEVLTEYERTTGGLVFAVPIDIVFSQHDVVAPDVVFFRAERRHLVDMMGTTMAAPDLAVEVLSPSTEARDRGRKMQLLARFGVPEYWIVEPAENRLEIYALRGDRYDLFGVHDEQGLATSPTLPGLSFAVGRLFEQ